MKNIIIITIIIIIQIINLSVSEYEFYCEDTLCVERFCYEFYGCYNNDTCEYKLEDTDDGIECTIDSCDDRLGFIHTPNNALCPPDNLCESYICDPDAGCIATSISCPEPNLCQIPLGCVKSSGVCEYEPMDVYCDDGIDCTLDTCDPLIGCISTPNSLLCDTEGYQCLIGFCNGTIGCTYLDLQCDDGIDCSNDICDDDFGCISTLDDTNCDTGNKCLSSVCTVNGCVSTPISCNDVNPCSDDYCDPLIGCASTLNNTKCNTAGNKCLSSECTVNGCVNTPISCNDGNSCSDDSCNPSTGCVNILNNTNCDDGLKCTIDQCTSTGCQHTNKICNPISINILGLGLLCKSQTCDTATGNCTPNGPTVDSLLCFP